MSTPTDTSRDFTVRNEGSIFLLTPHNDEVRAWIDDNVPSDAQWFGNALVVEHRYVAELVRGLQGAGFGGG